MNIFRDTKRWVDTGIGNTSQFLIVCEVTKAFSHRLIEERLLCKSMHEVNQKY